MLLTPQNPLLTTTVAHLEVLSDSVSLVRRENRQVVESHARRVDNVHEPLQLGLLIFEQTLVRNCVNFHHVVVVVL